jgi:hypothetical protein
MRNLIVSDLHVGGYEGLMPEKVIIESRTGECTTVRPNSTQKDMLAYFMKMTKEVGPVDNLIVNGDICDGPQRKSMGKNVWTNDLSVQARAAADLLSRIKAKHVYCTQGSEYHCMEDRPLEQYVAELLHGEYGDDLIIDNEGLSRFHVAHNVPVSKSSWQYRSTPIARDMLLMAVNQAREEYGKIDLVVRSHAHYWVCVGLGHQWGIITPGWQARTPFAVKHDIITAPDIGWVVVEIDDEGELDIKERHKHFGSCSKVVGR